MRQDIRERCVQIGKYIALTGDTVRGTARKFGMSKSSVHKDVHERLQRVHPGLFDEVQAILSYHHAVRHLRGGAATKLRWKMIREQRLALKGGIKIALSRWHEGDE